MGEIRDRLLEEGYKAPWPGAEAVCPDCGVPHGCIHLESCPRYQRHHPRDWRGANPTPILGDPPHVKALRDELAKLKRAVKLVYSAGLWKVDGLTPNLQASLWEHLRDAAGITPGQS